MSKLIPLREPLSDGVVSLRPWHLADAPAVTAACQDPEIPRWTRVPTPYTEADACEWLEDEPHRWHAGESAELAVVNAISGDLLGAVALLAIHWEDRRATIGYWVAAEARRRGVAHRAVWLLSDWAFQSLDLVRLQIIAEAENVASCRVAEASGFVPEGVRRQYLMTKQGSRDCLSFSRVRDDMRLEPKPATPTSA